LALDGATTIARHSRKPSFFCVISTISMTRRSQEKVTCLLDEVLLLCLLAVWLERKVARISPRFGDKKLDLLRRFRP
jgi:hypothetical protein